MNVPGLHGCRVLVVEDEAMVAMALEALLETAGCVAYRGHARGLRTQLNET